MSRGSFVVVADGVAFLHLFICLLASPAAFSLMLAFLFFNPCSRVSYLSLSKLASLCIYLSFFADGSKV